MGTSSLPDLEVASKSKAAEPIESAAVVRPAVDELEIRRPLSPCVGTAREAYRQPSNLKELEGRLRGLLDDPTTIKLIERDGAQIPAAANREGYFAENHLAYWLSGLADLRMVQQLIPSARYGHVLDFGGASGRFSRHVPLAVPSAQVTVAEININHVDWIDQYFDTPIRAIKASPIPHFPLADSSVTLCVGLSVFTHIDAYETTWLAEVHRVLGEGCHALLTIHSEHSWDALSTRPWMLELLQTDPNFSQTYRPGEPMHAERLVYNYATASKDYNCNVFTTCAYIHRVWGRWFEVVDIAPRAHHDFQTAVVLRKRARRSRSVAGFGRGIRSVMAHRLRSSI
jgi:hypothetical protein